MASASGPKSSSAAASKPGVDPRYRPFRVAAYAVYLVVVSAFSLLVIRSVVTSVMRMTPGREPPADVTLTVSECVGRAEGLFQELEQERAKQASTFPAARADDTWGKFRITWMQRYRDAEARCALESRSRERLRTAFSRLTRVMDLFTVSSVQYAGEAGGAVDALRDALDQARKDPSAGTLR